MSKDSIVVCYSSSCKYFGDCHTLFGICEHPAAQSEPDGKVNEKCNLYEKKEEANA